MHDCGHAEAGHDFIRTCTNSKFACVVAHLCTHACMCTQANTSICKHADIQMRKLLYRYSHFPFSSYSCAGSLNCIHTSSLACIIWQGQAAEC